MPQQKLSKSFKYAFTGFRIVWNEERNFQIEIVCALVVILLGMMLHLSVIEFSIIFLTIGFVLAIELINTALEELCDKFQPSHDPHIAKIKDLSAAAVLVSATGACIVGAIIFGSHLIGPVTTLDIRFEGFLYSVRNPLIVKMFSIITDLGKVYVVAAVGGITTIVLWILKQKKQVLALLTTLCGTAASVTAIKLLLQRGRPEELIPVHIESSYSFPSWHAAISIALYGFLGYILWKYHHNTALRYIFVCASIIIILLVGFSRLYLGVHYPTDILGGYILGGIWLLVGISVYHASKK